MSIRSILPEEFLPAYYWRCVRQSVDLEGARLDIKPLDAAQWKSEKALGRIFTSVLDWTQLSASDLVRLHTFLPARMPVQLANCDKSVSSLFSTRRYVGFAARHDTRVMRLCEDCLAEDRRALGIAYWKRHHQIPGVHRCLKHRSPLVECIGEDVVKLSPRGATISEAVETRRAPFASTKYPLVGRFAKVCELLLATLREPLDRFVVSNAVCKRSTQVLNWYPDTPNKLHHLVHGRVPERWIRDIRGHNRSGVLRDKRWIDLQLHVRGTGHHWGLALVLAAMWSDPNEAISDLYRALANPPDRPTLKDIRARRAVVSTQ